MVPTDHRSLFACLSYTYAASLRSSIRLGSLSASSSPAPFVREKRLFECGRVKEIGNRAAALCIAGGPYEGGVGVE